MSDRGARIERESLAENTSEVELHGTCANPDDPTHDDPNAAVDESCGFPAGSFACRIRHIQIATGGDGWLT